LACAVEPDAVNVPEAQLMLPDAPAEVVVDELVLALGEVLLSEPQAARASMPRTAMPAVPMAPAVRP
jgi:hypothetical protein